MVNTFVIPLLEVRNLTTEFRIDGYLTRAIKSVNFSLSEGETLGIVGESGSGKSMSALSIMRLVPPPGKITSGEVIFSKGDLPVDLLTLPQKEMRHYRGKEIAMIFQEPMTSLNPVLPCGSQVNEALMVHLKMDRKEARLRTLELFNRVRLRDPERIFNSYPHHLSGGQKQRVMIAMAMSCCPALLIADEPTTSLDVTVQAGILNMMNELRRENNMSMIFITHDLAVIAEIADRVIVMYQGEIVEQGSIEQIFYDPQHPYTRGLLRCRPPLDKKLKRLPVISDFMKEEDDQLQQYSSIDNQLKSGNEISKEESTLHLSELMQQDPLLQVINLCIWFPARRSFSGSVREYVKAVDNISFDVYEGETLGLVGESGCGKTTLAKGILQLLKPASGQVIFDSNNLGELTNDEMRMIRRNIQIIYQDPYSSLNPRLTIGSAIMEPMQVHELFGNNKTRKEKVIELLQKVNLPPDSYFRFPHEFSGGQRQRICIARALAVNPRFMICDECVSALDVSVQAQVLNLLIELREDFRFTCIFISHDLSVVKFMSDRIMVMNEGKIEEIGPAEAVYHHPSSRYTQKLITAIPHKDAGFKKKIMGLALN